MPPDDVTVVVAVVPEPVVVVVVPDVVAVSMLPFKLVLTKSISNIWFLTGTISFELGVTIILICDDVKLSTLRTPVILTLLIVIKPES